MSLLSDAFFDLSFLVRDVSVTSMWVIAFSCAAFLRVFSPEFLPFVVDPEFALLPSLRLPPAPPVGSRKLCYPNYKYGELSTAAIIAVWRFRMS